MINADNDQRPCLDPVESLKYPVSRVTAKTAKQGCAETMCDKTP